MADFTSNAMEDVNDFEPAVAVAEETSTDTQESQNEESQVTQESTQETAKESAQESEEKSRRITTIQTVDLEENSTDAMKNTLFVKLLEFLESGEGSQFCYHHCESVTPENVENLAAQRYVAIVVNGYSFMACKNLPMHVKYAMSANESRGSRGGRGGFRGRGAGRGGRGGRGGSNGNASNWIDYNQVRKQFHMQVMRNKYTLDDAKDHVAKQVFRYFGYSDVTVDDEETQEDAFRAMRSWNASATLERFLPEVSINIELPKSGNFTVNLEYNGSIKSTSTEKSLHLARHVTSCAFLRNEEFSNFYYTWTKQSHSRKGKMPGSMMIADEEQKDGPKDQVKQLRKLANVNHLGKAKSGDVVGWNREEMCYEVELGISAFSGENSETAAKEMVEKLENMGMKHNNAYQKQQNLKRAKGKGGKTEKNGQKTENVEILTPKENNWAVMDTDETSEPTKPRESSNKQCMNRSVLGSINSYPKKKAKMTEGNTGGLSIAEIIANQKNRSMGHSAKAMMAKEAQKAFLTTNVQSTTGMALSVSTPSNNNQGMMNDLKQNVNMFNSNWTETAENAIAEMKAAEKTQKNMALGMCPETNPIGFCMEFSTMFTQTISFGEDSAPQEVDGVKCFSSTVTWGDDGPNQAIFIGRESNKKAAKTEAAKKLTEYLMDNFPNWREIRNARREAKASVGRGNRRIRGRGRRGR